MADNNTQLDDKAIAAIAKLTRAGLGVQTAPNGIPFVLVPNDCKIENLAPLIYNQHAEHPQRKIGTIQVYDGKSFCEYYQQFADSFSRIFADESKPQVLGVLDYHGAGENAPRWCQHRVAWVLKRSAEWIVWTKASGVKMTQADFAEFIESNAPDIVDPPAATMLEVARTLSAKTEAEFSSAIRMANGSVKLTFNEQVRGTFGSGDLEVPEFFSIAVPVYVGDVRVTVKARLRYRIAAGKATFWYDLWRADAVEREAFAKVRDEIQAALGVTLINGSPA